MGLKQSLATTHSRARAFSPVTRSSSRLQKSAALEIFSNDQKLEDTKKRFSDFASRRQEAGKVAGKVSGQEEKVASKEEKVGSESRRPLRNGQGSASNSSESLSLQAATPNS